MSQRHFEQQGTFHVITNTYNKIPWCIWKHAPDILIDNLRMTKNVQKAQILSFCILPDHIHILLRPGEKGLSRFMQSFKSNSLLDLRKVITLSVAESRSFPLQGIKWQKGFYDERIRDIQQRTNTIQYIYNNPVKHNLTTHAYNWQWSSLHYKDIVDPLEVWI